MPTISPGYILAEKYQLISLIGRGGMGSVWRAQRLEWGSAVAVKLMDRATEANPVVLARFQQEARLAANLRSSHVVQILDDGLDAATGTPFIVMELLVGESLAQRLSRIKRLSTEDTARIVTHVARALSLAHELPMVHRDLKPDNIFLVRNDDEEIAKVLDFGIAKWNSDSFKMGSPTATGTVIGTPFYMSPEQISDSKRVDFRTDLWSLGVIAYECVTGQRAFAADNLLALALEICSGRPATPSSLAQVPSGFDAWFERATARQPAERFQSARELADELRRVSGVTSSAPPAQILRDEELGLSAPGARAAVAEHAATATFQASDPQLKSVAGLTRTNGGLQGPRSNRRLQWISAAVVACLALATCSLTLLRSGASREVPQIADGSPVVPRTPPGNDRAGDSIERVGSGAAAHKGASAETSLPELTRPSSPEPAVSIVQQPVPEPIEDVYPTASKRGSLLGRPKVNRVDGSGKPASLPAVSARPGRKATQAGESSKPQSVEPRSTPAEARTTPGDVSLPPRRTPLPDILNPRNVGKR